LISDSSPPSLFSPYFQVISFNTFVAAIHRVEKKPSVPRLSMAYELRPATQHYAEIWQRFGTKEKGNLENKSSPSSSSDLSSASSVFLSEAAATRKRKNPTTSC
jgi:hypothetical protein